MGPTPDRWRDGNADWEGYVRVLLRLGARVGDSHSAVLGDPAVQLRGEASPPIHARFIEGLLVVTDTFAEARDSGISVGDVITTIDGVSVRERFEHWMPLVSSSTPWAHRHTIAGYILRGSAATDATLTVLGREGQTRTLTVPRKKRWDAPERRGKPTYELISSEIGYVDLDRLTIDEVEPMFDALEGTRAIIFDMRGYPNRTMWSIAPRLNRHPDPRYAAEFDMVLLSIRDAYASLHRNSHRFSQALPPLQTAKPYRGLTVMLMDERTASQSEHTGLFLKAANDTTFIGGNTVGADGGVTTYILPGGLRGRMGGAAVRHPDGRQLQRVGLIPDVHVEPTLAGIREGRDEVLQAALDHVRTRLD